MDTGRRVRQGETHARAAGPRVAVVGAGWAGLAAAVAAREAGAQVSVLERAPVAGGRARGIDLKLGDTRLRLDNGQHLLVGAYAETLALMRRVGVDPEDALLRLPLRIAYPDGLRVAAPRWPAPFHLLAALLGARGLGPGTKWSALRAMAAARRADWTLPRDTTVSDWLAAAGADAASLRKLWRPLCIAALNTPPEQASAQAFLHVLRDTLGGSREASDFLIPREDLSAVLPDAACAWLAARDADLRFGASVESLERIGDDGRPGWRLRLRGGETLDADAVVLAAGFRDALRLLEPLAGADGGAALTHTLPVLRALRPSPIGTAWLRVPDGPHWREPILALQDGPDAPGQWLFARQAAPGGTRVLGVVLSAMAPRGEAGAMDADALRGPLIRQLRAQLPLASPLLPDDLPMRLVVEHDATWLCTPGLRRPGAETGLPGLLMAGDHVRVDAGTLHPATLESAVRSGGLAGGMAASIRPPAPAR